MVAVVGIVVPAGLIPESEFQQLQRGLGNTVCGARAGVFLWQPWRTVRPCGFSRSSLILAFMVNGPRQMLRRYRSLGEVLR
jgi:hypothetical protein